MNKINLDFEREKSDFKWNFIIFIYQIIFFIIPVLIYTIGKNSICLKNITESQRNEVNIDNNSSKKIKKSNDELSQKNTKKEE